MNKKVIEALAKALNLKVEELTQAIATEEEVDFKLPENLKVMTAEQLEELKDNHGKTRYDAGATAAREMLLKEMSKDAGLETIKDPKEFLNQFKANVLKDAKAEPNEKIGQLETTIETLRGKLEEKDGMMNQLKGQMESEKRYLTIQTAIPDLPETLNLTKQEATALYLQGREFKEDGIYLNGKRLEDDVAKPIDIQTDVQSWVKSKGWTIEQPKGRGGGAGGGKGGGLSLPKTIEEYESALREKGLHPGSQEAKDLLASAAAKHPEILD